MTDFDDIPNFTKPDTQTAEEQAEQVRSDQQGKKYDDIKQAMESRNRFILEMDKLPSQNHLWIDRGAKMTCENAGHQYHEAFKRLR